MKKIDCNIFLKNDIKKLKNKNRKWDIILGRILNALGASVFSVCILFGLSKVVYLQANLIITISTFTLLNMFNSIRLMFKDFQERKLRTLESEANIRTLAHSINFENKNANNLIPDITYDAIVDSVTTKEVNVEKDIDNSKKTKTITTNYFLLDTENKLRVLREIREIIKTKEDVIVNDNIYLLEEEDIPKRVPVCRTLERK